ncbi:metallophosphoesterase [Sporosarcina ureilytica]|uniref:Phosphoesterase n=1 Tax=Sporosarcina ureilytica TaxID=298596 RepID=A0A1D8JHM8_9BACL|nr:metallophosphoesterase [Sporosarcina ureilytica]AOV08196.1 phosphoesterase [Sporosarcina ureilytica]
MKKRLLFSIIGLLLLTTFLYSQNNWIKVTKISIRSDKLPKHFEGYKIVQLSDLHGKGFGKNQIKLINQVNRSKPHLIVFTGDLVDANQYEEEAGLKLMEELVQIAPVYFVTGNHEWWSGRFNSLETKLNDLGVMVLRNDLVEIYREQEKLSLIGIDDPANGNGSDTAITEEAIAHSIKGYRPDNFMILLAHRPEMLSLYAHYQFDIVFTGHAHGGQFRIPFIGGLIAPDQGLFPKYTSGKHTKGNTVMVVNRGLGNSIIPFRVFNRPEIIVTSLTHN